MEKTLIIDKFYGGISDDVRQQTNGTFFLSKHFDVLRSPGVITPYETMVADTSISGTNTSITNYAPENFVYVNGAIFAAGRVTAGNGKLRILEKTTAYASSEGNWTLSASSSQTGTGEPQRSSFAHYKDYLFGVRASATLNKANVWKYGALSTGVRALNETLGGADVLSLTNTALADATAATPCVGPDDNLYIPYENKLARVDQSFNITAEILTLPSIYTITSLTVFQNYLAIACRPSLNTSSYPSMVFLYDPNGTGEFDDLKEKIDWGYGNLNVLETIDGVLVGVSSSSGFNRNVTTIKTYSGGAVNTIKTLPYTGSTFFKAKEDGRLYFALTENSNTGIWVVGRVGSEYPWSVTCAVNVNGSTNVSSLYGFTFVGRYLYASHNVATETSVSKFDSNGTYTDESFILTQKYNGGDITALKSLVRVALGMDPLPSGGSISLDYRVDYTSSQSDVGWTNIFTETTLRKISREAVIIESTGMNFPNFYEIQFRIRSTGGAKPRSIKLGYIVLETQFT